MEWEFHEHLNMLVATLEQIFEHMILFFLRLSWITVFFGIA